MAKTANIPCVCLAVGEDELKRNEVLTRLRARLEEEGDLSFDADSFNGDTCTGSEIVSACETVPFMAPRRLVVVERGEALKKADQDALTEYAKNPCESTVLALSMEKLAKSSKLYKTIAALGANAVIDCALPKGRDLQKKVLAMAASHEVRFNDAAAALLIEFVGTDTVFLDNEIAKIALACADAPVITEKEVRDYVESTAEVKPWTFLEPFSDRNVEASLRWLAKAHNVSPHALVPLVGGRLRELICAKALDAKGQGRNLAKELGRSEAESWKFKNHLRYARKFSAEELRQALSALRDVDQAMKSGEDPDAAFSLWVLKTLAPRR